MGSFASYFEIKRFFGLRRLLLESGHVNYQNNIYSFLMTMDPNIYNIWFFERLKIILLAFLRIHIFEKSNTVRRSPTSLNIWENIHIKTHPALQQAGYKVSMYLNPNFSLNGWLAWWSSFKGIIGTEICTQFLASLQ